MSTCPPSPANSVPPPADQDSAAHPPSVPSSGKRLQFRFRLATLIWILVCSSLLVGWWRQHKLAEEYKLEATKYRMMTEMERARAMRAIMQIQGRMDDPLPTLVSEP